MKIFKMNFILKGIGMFFVISFLVFSCSTPNSTPQRIPFNFYMRDWEGPNGAILGDNTFNYPRRFDHAYYRPAKSLNYSQDVVPEAHFRRPETLLSAYLAVWNPILHRALYLSEPDEKFDNSYISSFRRNPPPRKKEERKEHLEILMEHKFTSDGTSYFFSRNIFHKYTGEKIPKCFCLQKKEDKWYFNDHSIGEVKKFYELFCRMKLDIAKAFIHTSVRPKCYPGYDLTEPLPPSGNKYRDKEIMKIYITTHTHMNFNVDKFYQMGKQWEKEGKKGLLNYFFEY